MSDTSEWLPFWDTKPRSKRASKWIPLLSRARYPGLCTGPTDARMRFRARATFERNTGSSPLASMHCFGLATTKVVLLKSSGARARTSGEEYTATLCDASLKPLDRREVKSRSPVMGGCTIASVWICMPHLRYQASWFNSIRCYIDNCCTSCGRGLEIVFGYVHRVVRAARFWRGNLP